MRPRFACERCAVRKIVRRLFVGSAIAAGAWAFLAILSSPAIADVADPFSPVSNPASRELPVLETIAPEPQTAPETQALPVEELAPAILSPAEQSTKFGITKISRQTAPNPTHATLLTPVREVVAGFGSMLSRLAGQVSTACEMGIANAVSGGPALLFAIIGAFVAFEMTHSRRRLDRTEERPWEFLYAREVIAPG